MDNAEVCVRLNYSRDSCTSTGFSYHLFSRCSLYFWTPAHSHALSGLKFHTLTWSLGPVPDSPAPSKTLRRHSRPQQFQVDFNNGAVPRAWRKTVCYYHEGSAESSVGSSASSTLMGLPGSEGGASAVASVSRVVLVSVH